MIGFQPDTYSVSEDAGSVGLTVRVLSGTLGGEVLVGLRTVNDSALGMLWSICVCLSVCVYGRGWWGGGREKRMMISVCIPHFPSAKVSWTSIPQQLLLHLMLK